jgi:RNA polymerase sigma factor (TIGR02999 family)
MDKKLQTDSPNDAQGQALSTRTAGEVTQLLGRWNAKCSTDQAKLLELVYPELKRIAEFRMRRERPDHTLQATALVNEFVVQLCAAVQQPVQDRLHFMAIASRAMRRILVDHARSHNADKRGGTAWKVELASGKLPQPRELRDILEIHDLLEKLAAQDDRMAEVVEMRYFGGLSNSEVAKALGVAERTVKRDWQLARAWLFAHLHRGKSDAG